MPKSATSHPVHLDDAQRTVAGSSTSLFPEFFNGAALSTRRIKEFIDYYHTIYIHGFSLPEKDREMNRRAIITILRDDIIYTLDFRQIHTLITLYKRSGLYSPYLDDVDDADVYRALFGGDANRLINFIAKQDLTRGEQVYIILKAFDLCKGNIGAWRDSSVIRDCFIGSTDVREQDRSRAEKFGLLPAAVSAPAVPAAPPVQSLTEDELNKLRVKIKNCVSENEVMGLIKQAASKHRGGDNNAARRPTFMDNLQECFEFLPLDIILGIANRYSGIKWSIRHHQPHNLVDGLLGRFSEDRERINAMFGVVAAQPAVEVSSPSPAPTNISSSLGNHSSSSGISRFLKWCWSTICGICGKVANFFCSIINSCHGSGDAVGGTETPIGNTHSQVNLALNGSAASPPPEQTVAVTQDQTASPPQDQVTPQVPAASPPADPAAAAVTPEQTVAVTVTPGSAASPPPR